MAINVSSQPRSIATDDNLLIMCAPLSAVTSWPDAPTVSELAAASFVDVTYSLTAGSGWAEATNEDDITDERLTLSEVFSKGGRTTNTLSLQYVYGTEDDVADPLFVERELLVFAVRFAVEHDEPIAAGQKFDFWLVEAGRKQRDQAAANAVFTKTQAMRPQAKVKRDVAITAS